MRLPGDADNDGAAVVSVTVAVLVVPPPVTVMVAVLTPTVAAERLMPAVREPLPDPEVGVSVSQEVLLVAVQLPFDVMVTD